MAILDQKAASFWHEVQDEDLWALVTVERKEGATVHLSRSRAPEGVPLTLTMSEEELQKLTPAAGGADNMAPADLTALEEVSAGAVQHALRLRYERGDIYTSIGHSVLVAVNPFEALPICGTEYLDELQALATDELPPHAYSVARLAYESLCASCLPQSILVGGESGAGKTETTKLCMRGLAQASGSSGRVAEAVLESGVALEAFGNAKTTHNNNSSRFGRWCAVHFDARGGFIAGAKVDSFLLEKSRVVSQGAGERNYHVFYQMTKGASAAEREAWRLRPSTGGGGPSYAYTSGAQEVSGVDDGAAWHATRATLGVLGVAEEAQVRLFGLIAAVLALGNVAFEPAAAAGTAGGGGGEGQLAATAPDDVAALLQVAPPLLSDALTVRHVSSGKRGSSYKVPLMAQQCIDARDALAKELFARLFDWVVTQLNDGMAAAGAISGGGNGGGGNGGGGVGGSDNSGELFVGLLDVFGFENFEVNSFEQLCINYANEKLQKHFIDAVGRLQLLDYQREGISTAAIRFPDNSAQIECVDGKMGVMALLDEELSLPKASEEGYVAKLHARFGGKEYEGIYAIPRGKGAKGAKGGGSSGGDGKGVHALQFALVHYAGDVLYTAHSWLDKNRLGVPSDLMRLMGSSESELLQTLFAADADATLDESSGGAAEGRGGGGGGRRKRATVFSSFRTSLRSLSATLERTSARYVRCIKPNAQKVRAHFDGRYTHSQLQCTGVTAVVELQRCGYAVSMRKVDFVARYRWCVAYDRPELLAAEGTPRLDSLIGDLLRACRALLRLDGDWGDADFQLGRSKVFLREAVTRALERARTAAWDRYAAKLQRALRRLYARRAAALLRSLLPLVEEARGAAAAQKLDAAREAVAAMGAAWEAGACLLPAAALGVWRRAGAHRAGAAGGVARGGGGAARSRGGS